MYLNRMKGWPDAEMKGYWRDGLAPISAYDKAVHRRMSHEDKALRGEEAGMRAYRDKYPDGPPWQQLNDELRAAWVEHAKKLTPNFEVSGLAPRKDDK